MTSAASSAAVADLSIEVAGCKTRYLRGGSGPALLVLHHDIGNHGWLPFHEQLATRFTVYLPDFPGWGESERPTWMRSLRDMAVVMQSLTDRLKIDAITTVGLGFGGWVAAEMATMDQRRQKALVLVGAAGVQPPEGEIADQFLLAYDDYVKLGFSDPRSYAEAFTAEPPTDTLVAWDIHREMVARIAWKPYMFSQTLPYLLGDLDLQTLVIHGGADRVVPLSCSQRYHQAIAGSRLEVIAGAGHYVEMERPAEVAKLIITFAG